MEFYQIKIIRKGTKPPVWRRCLVPGDITFTQMAVILEEILEYRYTDRYEFEFFQEKLKIREWKEDQENADSKYGRVNASDTVVNELLDKMTWFTFRVEADEEKLPEYRAEVEKKTAVAETGECSPCIIKEKTGEEDPYWSDVKEKNSRLESRFILKDGRFDDCCFTESRESEDSTVSGSSRNPRVTEYLQAYEKEDLDELAENLNVSGTDLKKSELVEKISAELLKPEVMKKNFLMADEWQFQAFEDALKKNLFYVPDKEWDELEWASDIGYLAVFDDGFAEVPKEVKAVYDQISTPEFQVLQKRTSWLNSCMIMFGYLYAVAPVKILYKMYRSRKECKVSHEEFYELFHSVPEEMNICTICEDKVVMKEILEDKELYSQIQDSQLGREFYIPSEDEITDYVKNGYPSKDPVYKDLYEFLVSQMEMDPDLVEGYLCVIYRIYYTGGYMPEVMEVLNDNGVTFQTKEQARAFAELLGKAYKNTRRIELCGHTPDENVSSTYSNSSVIPGTWNAGKTVHNEGMTVEKNKKIYPNDPCPCGSGKKYKKCCGRN